MTGNCFALDGLKGFIKSIGTVKLALEDSHIQ